MLLKITVCNWQKYNPRSDRANYTWFRFQNDFFTDQTIFPIQDSERMTLIFLMCEASKKNSDTIELRLDFIGLLLRKKNEDVLASLELLRANSLISLINGEAPADSRQIAGEQPANSLATYVRNERNVTEGTAADRRETTYEFFDQGKKKKEKKPKPKLSCETIPELLSLKEILESRQVPTLLQQKWVKLYHPAAIARGIQKADAWAVAKGEEKKNWGQFFNNWLIRDHEGRGTFQAMLPAAEPTRKLSAWQEMELAKEKQREGEPNEPERT